MRGKRTLVGLILVLIGLPSLLAGSAGLLALQHRDGDGGFTTQLAPIHADGYAVVVPDVDAAMSHSGLASVFGSGPLRVGVRGSNVPVLLAVARTADARRYLAGVPHSELTTVGVAAGDAPVTTVTVPGRRSPATLRGQSFWLATGAVKLDFEPRSDPLSLIALRSDGKPGLDLRLAVTRFVPWLVAATIGLLMTGFAGMLGGVVLLFVAAEPVLVVEPHRVVEFADRLAGSLDTIAPGESLALVRRARGLDLTGELVTVRSGPGRRWWGRRHSPPESDPTVPVPERESPYVYTAT